MKEKRNPENFTENCKKTLRKYKLCIAVTTFSFYQNKNLGIKETPLPPSFFFAKHTFFLEENQKHY